MLYGMGRKTSVWLPGDLADRVKASGVPMAELIRRGLDAGEPVPLEDAVREAVRAELEAWEPPAPVSVSAAKGTAKPAAGTSGPAAAAPSAARTAMRRAADLQAPPRCPHAGVRVTGGWCAGCQADVKPGGRLPDDWMPPEGWSAS